MPVLKMLQCGLSGSASPAMDPMYRWRESLKNVTLAQAAIKQFLIKLYPRSRAQDMVEYALLAGFIALTIGGTFPIAGRPFIKISKRLLAMLTLAAGGSSSVSC